jgi:hypothetical protein
MFYFTLFFGFVYMERLPQNFGFRESSHGFRGKSGPLAAFSKAVSGTGAEPRVRALGMALEAV